MTMNTTDEINEVIFHDIDEELDDQTAIKKYIDFLEMNPQINRTIYLVATNGAYKSNLNSDDRNTVLYDYFPEYSGLKSFKEGSSTFHILNIEEVNKVTGMTFRMLQIAPLTGVSPEFFENNTIISRVLMGEHLPIPSLNTNKSWCNNMGEFEAQQLDEDFTQQNVYLSDVPTRYITTTFARKVPFSFETIDNLPDHFKSKLYSKVFDMFVGRVPPQLGFCENVTCGANHPTALSYMKTFELDGHAGQIPIPVPSTAVAAAVVVVASTLLLPASVAIVVVVALLWVVMVNVATASVAHPSDDSEILKQVNEFTSQMINCKDKKTMTTKLFDINKIVYLVTGNVYSKIDGKYSFSPNSLENYDESFDKFMKLLTKYKPTLTPAYDVLAMYDFIHKEVECDYIIPLTECDTYTEGIKNM